MGPARHATTLLLLLILSSSLTPLGAVDEEEPNNTTAQATHAGSILSGAPQGAQQTLSVEEAALEANGTSDWYSFLCPSSASLAARVEPLSTDTSPRNARNLALRLWRRVSSQTGPFELLAQIDFQGAGLDEYHPPLVYSGGGLDFWAIEIYSTDGQIAVQPYQLRISDGPIDPAPGKPRLLVQSGLQTIDAGGTLTFPNTIRGERAGIALSLRNIGDAPLIFSGQPTLQGEAAADYSLGALPAEIAPLGIGVLGIDFRPRAVGQRTAILTLLSNDPDRPGYNFFLSGQGVADTRPDVAVDPTALEFGAVEAGETAARTLRVRNSGLETLRVSSMKLGGADAGAYFLTGLPAFPLELARNQAHELTVSFQASDGSVSGQIPQAAVLLIASDDHDEPLMSVPLSATVVAEDDTLRLALGLPRLEALDFEVEVEDTTLPVRLRLLVDALGRPALAGDSSVGDEPVTLTRSSLKLNKSTGRWAYSLTLAGTVSSSRLKVEGELGTGRAEVQYRGDLGRAKLEDAIIAESAQLDTITRIRLQPILDAQGRISGTGTIEAGLGSDTGAAPGILKGAFQSVERMSWTLKDAALKRKLSFKGVLAGDVFVGELKYQIAPGKGTLVGFEIPAAMFLRN